MVRSVFTVALLLAACSSPATSTGREGTPPDRATTASDKPLEVSLRYRLVPGTTSTRVVRETIASTSSANGDDVPDELRAQMTATVLQPRDGAHVVDYRLDEVQMKPPDEDPKIREFMAAFLEELKGRTHARTLTPLGVSRALITNESVDESVIISGIENMQLPVLHDQASSVGTEWPDCVADYDPDESDRESRTTCRIVAIDDIIIEIAVITTSGDDTDPPGLRGIPKESIAVAASASNSHCVYRVALDDPLPLSCVCDEVTRKSGTAAGEPFTYQVTTHTIVENIDRASESDSSNGPH